MALVTVLAMIAVLPAAVYSRSDDTEQPMHIKADTAELNDKTGVSVYRGDVRFTQGSIVLTGDKVTVTAPKRRIQHVVSTGNPSTFRQLTDDGREVHAKALRMEYDTSADTITLINQAKLDQGGNVFTSEHIVYHITRELVNASNPEGKKRVNITILPDTNQPDSESAGDNPAADRDESADN